MRWTPISIALLMLPTSLSAAPPANTPALIAAARAEAKLALNQTDMLTLRRHLQRATNCLVGRDSGSYLGTVGSACNSGLYGVLGANPTRDRKAELDAVVQKLLTACAQGDLDYANDLAGEAVTALAQFH